MRPPLLLTGSIRSGSRLVMAIFMGLFLAIGLVSLSQSRRLWKSTGQDVSTSGVMAQAMRARLNGVSQGITSYLQNHDPNSLERIKSEGREASKVLGDLKDQAAQNGKSAAFERVEKAHEELREATVDLLSADHAALKARETLKQSNDSLMSLLRGTMEASIKSSQLNASARLRAIHGAIDQAQSASNYAAPGNDLESARSHFRRFLAAYEELSRTRRSERWSEEARSLFDQCVKQTRDLIQMEDQKQAALSRYTEKLKALVQLIQVKNSLFSSGSGKRFVEHVFDSGVVSTMILAVLLLAGMVLTFGLSRRTDTQVIAPLQEMLQCVEAAATGDISRVPDHWSRDEVGQLSQAIGRLISVLARSENLVYHLAALVEGSGEAIISHTLDGTILSWNKGAQRIYGYSAEEVKGRSIVILSPYDSGAEMMRNLNRIRQGERLQPFETLHQARNGRTVRALVRVSAILDSTRKVIGASFCAQDLTDTNLTHQKAVEGSQIA